MSFLFEQLPLAVQLREDCTFDNFYPGDNALIIDALRQRLLTDQKYIFIHGSSGSGLSHLLQAACRYVQDENKQSVYLPLQELKNYPPAELFEGMEQLDLVCLDDIDLVVGNPDWEQALFHLFNRLHQRQSALLIAAKAPLREMAFTLPDLASRLNWGTGFYLRGLGDEQRRTLLKMRAKRRGLELGDEALQYILNHSQRDTASLLMILDKLDVESLKQHRRLTIPFIKDIMAW